MKNKLNLFVGFFCILGAILLSSFHKELLIQKELTFVLSYFGIIIGGLNILNKKEGEDAE